MCLFPYHPFRLAIFHSYSSPPPGFYPRFGKFWCWLGSSGSLYVLALTCYEHDDLSCFHKRRESFWVAQRLSPSRKILLHGLTELTWGLGWGRRLFVTAVAWGTLGGRSDTAIVGNTERFHELRTTTACFLRSVVILYCHLFGLSSERFPRRFLHVLSNKWTIQVFTRRRLTTLQSIPLGSLTFALTVEV
jgi:hypothetical protein